MICIICVSDVSTYSILVLTQLHYFHNHHVVNSRISLLYVHVNDNHIKFLTPHIV